MQKRIVLGWVGFACTLNACQLMEQNVQRLCFAGTDDQTTQWTALVRLKVHQDGNITGDSYGSLSQPQNSYAADYRQTVTGHLKANYLQLNVLTQLRASRDDIEGYPAQTQETWFFDGQQVTPTIRKIPLKKTNCGAIDASLQQDGRWLRGEGEKAEPFPLPD